MTLMKFSESLEITPRTSQLETLTELVSLTQQILFDIHLTHSVYFCPGAAEHKDDFSPCTHQKVISAEDVPHTHVCQPCIFVKYSKALWVTLNRECLSGRQYRGSIESPQKLSCCGRRGGPSRRGMPAVPGQADPGSPPAAATRGSCPAAAPGGRLDERPRNAELPRAGRQEGRGAQRPARRGSRRG